MIDYIDRVMSIPSCMTPEKSKVNMIKKWMSSTDKTKKNKAKKTSSQQSKAKKANKDKLPAMTKSKSNLTDRDVPQNVQVSTQ